jgi:hypothetical protein
LQVVVKLPALYIIGFKALCVQCVSVCFLESIVGKGVPNSEGLMNASGDRGIAGEGAGSASASGGRVNVLKETFYIL